MKEADAFETAIAQINAITPLRPVGKVTRVKAGLIEVSGLQSSAHLGDWLQVRRYEGPPVLAEIVQLEDQRLIALPEQSPEGVALGDLAILMEAPKIHPSLHWIGRIIDASGQPLDGKPLPRGPVSQPLQCAPPRAAQRNALGARMETGLAVTNTVLPIVQGQRIGIFAGSGVGKSTLMGSLATRMAADVVVIAMIGERGRELRHFVDETLSEEGRKRSIIVAATSDQSPLLRRRCAWTAMAIAEYFRDIGKSVLFLADSITRFAEAHREVAVASGEAPVLRGYPPSTAHQIMQLCERAGPGTGQQGSITGIFSVLVAGSDMEEPIADILRGVLDGHIVLDREIAERGRFPAVDVLRSVSRSLPAAASSAENLLLGQIRKILGIYDQNALMIKAGLYSAGSDAEIDQAIAVWPNLDHYFGGAGDGDISQSFAKLELLLRRAKINPAQTTPGPPA